MQLDMSPKNERAFVAASKTLVEDFRTWCEETGQAADPWLAELLLHYKWSHLGRKHLGRWEVAGLVMGAEGPVLSRP